MKLFLLIYDRRRGILLERREFPAEQRRDALRVRFESEAAHRDEEDLEVVLLGAESWADVEKTHGRYFKSSRELLRPTTAG